MSAPRILVVEDTPANLKVISAALKESYPISVATNGKDAISFIAKDESIGLLLLDLTLPDMHGFDVLYALRANEALHGTPVIVLTASTNDDDRANAEALDAIGYMLKPIDQNELKKRVANALAHSNE